MTREFVNRIPGEEVSQCKTWPIPEIEGGKVLPSAEKEERERKAQEAKARGEVVGETVESDELNGPITAAELEKITEQAHQEGYDAGLILGKEEGLKLGAEEGEKQAFAQTQDRLSADIEHLTQLIDGLVDPYESESNQLHQIVLNTITSLTATVVKRELKTSPLEISKLVDMAIDALPNSSSRNTTEYLSIELHPDDIALLQEYFPAKVQHWPLRPEADMSRGGVIVRNRDSTVDYSVEKRLATLQEQFFNGELQEMIIEQESSIDSNSEIGPKPSDDQP